MRLSFNMYNLYMIQVQMLKRSQNYLRLYVLIRFPFQLSREYSYIERHTINLIFFFIFGKLSERLPNFQVKKSFRKYIACCESIKCTLEQKGF